MLFRSVNMSGFTDYTLPECKFINPELAKTASFEIALKSGDKSFPLHVFDLELLKIRKNPIENIGYHYIKRRSVANDIFKGVLARERYYIGIVDDKNQLVSNLVKYKHSVNPDE